VIGVVLYDANNQLLGITNCELVWALLDLDGVATPPLDVSISKVDATNGRMQINVPCTFTGLRPGRYDPRRDGNAAARSEGGLCEQLYSELSG
jgi:hypothetical protein